MKYCLTFLVQILVSRTGVTKKQLLFKAYDVYMGCACGKLHVALTLTECLIDYLLRYVNDESVNGTIFKGRYAARNRSAFIRSNVDHENILYCVVDYRKSCHVCSYFCSNF